MTGVYLIKLTASARLYPTLIAVALGVALVGCDFIGLGGDDQPAVAGVVIRTPGAPVPGGVRPAAATPTVSPLMSPTPTPTPAPSLTVADVQRLVFQAVRRCADEVSAATGQALKVRVDVTYSGEDRSWTGEAISDDGVLSFGKWKIDDLEQTLSPGDQVSATIATAPECNQPVALLSRGAAPPEFRTQTPTPTFTPVPTVTIPPIATRTPTPTVSPTPAPTPIPPEVATTEQAVLRVWMSVFDCYNHFPELASFIGHEDSPRGWVVEGNSAITHYGIWQVNGESGEITPTDILAKQASATCRQPAVTAAPGPPAQASFPAVVTLEQAELLIWFAVFDCFTPSPNADAFTAFQDNPQRWLVEGKDAVTIEVEVTTVVASTTETFIEERTQSVSYGLWLVDASTAAVSPWSDLAVSTRELPCYKTP